VVDFGIFIVCVNINQQIDQSIILRETNKIKDELETLKFEITGIAARERNEAYTILKQLKEEYKSIKTEVGEFLQNLTIKKNKPTQLLNFDENAMNKIIKFLIHL